MPKVTNTFIKSKLNKDLDARLIPNGEYRDALNVQVSRSEGDSVGSLENVLGNKLIKDFGNTDLTCIGFLTDETTGLIYVFLTDYTDSNPDVQRTYSFSAENYIYSYNIVNEQSILLVQGAFLNFSKTNPIFGINLIENLLFFTDNRNQPRKININLANPSAIATPVYYTTEDQISVAKYNPYRSIEVFQETSGNPAPVETTLKDVTSLFNPNGGTALANGVQSGTTILIDSINGDIIKPNQSYSTTAGSKISLSSGNPVILTDTGATVTNINYSGTEIISVTVSSSISVTDNQMLVFNPNINFDGAFAGDPDYLSDLFVRFSYRFKFEDGEYSIMAPFTQIAFIPNQDGYFMYVKKDGIKEIDDQSESYRSSVVSFMENKVDHVKLIIPKPDTLAGQTISEALKISEIDILMKESDGLAVKVVDTLQIANVTPNTYGDVEYQYKSTKPFKTLPSSELIRVYDKVPVRALAQETTGNRVVYANFQNKHTPPTVLDYTVAATEKAVVDLKNATATSNAAIPAGGSNNVNITNGQGFIGVGSIMSGPGVLEGTAVTQVTGSGSFADPYTNVAVTPNLQQSSIGSAFKFRGTNNPERTVSRAEYPSSSLKQNRNYQIGVVLSDRYGRQSSVILNDANQSSTIYSPYLDSLQVLQSWAGNSIKLLFNSGISPVAPIQQTEWPGIYNGNASSSLYNPLGWYSYKIVVKQTEQEYYNVYLPGVMAAYPENQVLELGTTSHIALISDNINKIPRDLVEVGPDQKQFRSSVRIFGRVQNTSTAITLSPNNFGKSNEQYYPSTTADTATIISTMRDMFEVDTTVQDDFKQFYDFESNPLIARISTTSQIGQISLLRPTATPPGLQYLAVYETEPVDSQLDIYWETNTTGLISSLNQAVLEGTSGVNGFSSFNSSNWSESLASNGNILDNVFTLQDTLGQNITLSGSDSFTLLSVINGVGQNVNAPSSVGPYFGLVVSGNTFQIKINSGYYNNVYFESNQLLRQFTFNFRSIIFNAGIPTTTLFSTFAAPTNVNPSITSTPVSGSTIRSNRNLTSTLATLVGINGANNSNLAGGSLTYNITSQTITGQTNQVNYFELTNPVVGNNSTTTLKNINSSTEVRSYDITVSLSDPGSTVQTTYTVDMAVQPNLVRDVQFLITPSIGGTQKKDCVMITLTQAFAGANQAGFYLYTGFPTLDADFQDLINASGGGTVSSPIQMDRTNAVTSGTSCGIWLYHPSSQTSLENLFFAACMPTGTSPDVNYVTVNASNYVFEVI